MSSLQPLFNQMGDKPPAAPVASPAPPAPYDPDPYYGTNTKTPAGVGSSPAPIGGSFAGGYPAIVPSASKPISAPNTQLSGALAAGLGQPNAPAAPQQPQFNPFMQTYGQNNTPQQQMFNRFPQSFQQPQPVAQPAQGPVYADQSLNAPDLQLQQYPQPQYGRFGRGFMPQNRGGYDRQLDQLRGGYNRPMPQIMPQQMPQIGPTQAQLNPFQAALVKGGTPYVQGAPGAPYAIGQGIPGGAPGGYMPLMNSNGTPVSSLASANPAGGKGGNPAPNGSTGQYQ
jgi:hypothetical protein